MALTHLTPLAWRIEDAERRVADYTAQWYAETDAAEKATLGRWVNEALDALDALRGEADL